jgi:hypothetical protein
MFVDERRIIMNITVAAYNFSDYYRLAIWKPLEITRETPKCYFTKSRYGERRFLKDEIGKVQCYSSNEFPCVRIVMVDAAEEELREKIAEWFEQQANDIRNKTK